MSLEEDILIQDFLKNTLSEQEKATVLLRIKKDENFRERVLLEEQFILNFNNSEWNSSKNSNHPDIKEYENLLRDESTLVLKDTLHKVNNEYQQKHKKINFSWLLYSGIAAVLVIIGLTLFSSPDISSNQVYANYIDLSELPSLVDRGSNDQKSLLIKAQKLFESKKYDQALAILVSNFGSPKKNKAAIYLYTGLSQMELNKFDEAIITFNTLIKSDLIDAPKGIWYKSLLFVKTGEISKAKELLQEITSKPSNYKFKEASELLTEL